MASCTHVGPKMKSCIHVGPKICRPLFQIEFNKSFHFYSAFQIPAHFPFLSLSLLLNISLNLFFTLSFSSSFSSSPSFSFSLSVPSLFLSLLHSLCLSLNFLSLFDSHLLFSDCLLFLYYNFMQNPPPFPLSPSPP